MGDNEIVIATGKSRQYREAIVPSTSRAMMLIHGETGVESAS